MSEAAAAASGDANMGSANVDMRPADTDMGPARAKVGASNVAATKVAPTEVPAAKVPAASVAAASMAASTPSKGCRWDCGATQKDSGDGHDHCFSKHRSLLVVFRSIKVSMRSAIDAGFTRPSINLSHAPRHQPLTPCRTRMSTDL
jgi:hypothetical protein